MNAEGHRQFWEIDRLPQNKVRHLVADFAAYGVPSDMVLAILLRRGVFKWLACRRDVIRLKHDWRDDVRAAQGKVAELKRRHGRSWWRGYLSALTICRQQVRVVCDSSRVRAPDNDWTARDYLRRTLGRDGVP